ncbi:hypothetical protein BDY19DRAFT_425705 [Irpex rosettiformis]|uniref:Uncharacterized protein n=1 Tax=Irpex rosettiformis TaxID=378272 RepID=A0ACB8UGM5_9APHY|nr:hypothetical protein BDY19DRAFT_425705 [Irpex rosettiformis]
MFRSQSPPANSRWLAMELAALLSAPHPGVPSESGPADLFNIRFDQMFEQSAHGMVCGREVNRYELKEAILTLKSKWDAERGTIVGVVARPGYFTSFHPTMGAKLEFTPLNGPQEQQTVTAEASGEDKDGSERIEYLRFEGDESLFKRDTQ